MTKCMQFIIISVRLTRARNTGPSIPLHPDITGWLRVISVCHSTSTLRPTRQPRRSGRGTHSLSRYIVRGKHTGMQPHGFSAYPSCTFMCLGAREKRPGSTGMRSGLVCENPPFHIIEGFGDLNFLGLTFGELFLPHSCGLWGLLPGTQTHECTTWVC